MKSTSIVDLLFYFYIVTRLDADPAVLSDTNSSSPTAKEFKFKTEWLLKKSHWIQRIEQTLHHIVFNFSC